MYFPAAVILQPDETLPSWIRHFVLSNAIYYGIKKSAASTDSWKRRCLFFGYTAFFGYFGYQESTLYYKCNVLSLISDVLP